MKQVSVTNNKLIIDSGGSAGEIGFKITNSKKLAIKVKDRGFLEEHSLVEALRKEQLKNHDIDTKK